MGMSDERGKDWHWGTGPGEVVTFLHGVGGMCDGEA